MRRFREEFMYFAICLVFPGNGKDMYKKKLHKLFVLLLVLSRTNYLFRANS